MRIAVTEFEKQASEAISNLSGDELLDRIYRILDAATDHAHSEGYSEGFDDGSSNIQDKIEDGISDATDGLLENLKTGLDLIDTDRTASKVYLDRATRTLDRHLIEVSPCLL